MVSEEKLTIFNKATNRQAYLKAGIMGFAGDGKSYTATQIAIGLVHYMRELELPLGDKPAMFLDTETGADWVMPMFQKADIELQVAKTRAFIDLVPAILEAEENGSVLVIDSISHFWRDLTESYAERKNRQHGLQFQDWAWLKKEWGKFTDAFVNSSCHIIMCGRAGYEYDFFEQEGGKKELTKTGIKMKAETETGYEPSILILMEKHRDLESGNVWRTASILKDRAALIDGQTFINPTFEHFRPHVEYLNLGGEHLGVDTTRNSKSLVPDSGKPQWQYDKEQKEIALEEIVEKMKEHYPGQSAADKQGRQEVLKKCFGTTSWKRVESLSRENIEAGRECVWQHLDGAPYTFELPEETAFPGSDDLEDDIPYDSPSDEKEDDRQDPEAA